MTSQQAALCAEFPPHKLLFYEFFLPMVWATCQHVDDTRLPSLRVSFPPAEPCKSSLRRKFDAGRFQSTDLFFHIGIYFFTARCTEWMKKESRWGKVFLPSFLLLSFSFFSAFRERIPSDCVFLLKGDDEWLFGIKLCGAPALMLRNTHIWKLGKFDLRSVAPSSAYTFHVWSNAAPQIAVAAAAAAAAMVAKRFIWKSSYSSRALIATGCYIDWNAWNISFLRQNVKLMLRQPMCNY